MRKKTNGRDGATRKRAFATRPGPQAHVPDSGTNWVALAIDELHGPTATANRLGVSGTSVHKWRRIGFVPGSQDCLNLANASGIPIAKLAGPRRLVRALGVAALLAATQGFALVPAHRLVTRAMTCDVALPSTGIGL